MSTFRDPAGVWAKYDWRDVATPEGFARNPSCVHDFYNMRRRAHQRVQPNAAHIALARLEREHGGVDIVTQNVDALHEAAGSHNLIHMHGEALKSFCMCCRESLVWPGDMFVETQCPCCGKSGGLRPDVVWFGEMPYELERIGKLIRACDLFVSIGTSGNVYPAAGFVSEARAAGAHTLELNLEPSEGATTFHEARYGLATEIVPHFVSEVLAGRH